MNLIQVDKVEVEALQAGFDGMHDVFARQANRIGTGSRSAAPLGRDDDAFAGNLEIAQRLTENLFREALRIDIGGVDEINAGRERTFDQGIGVALIDLAHVLPPGTLAAECHGAQADFRHIKAGPAQRTMFHRSTPFGLSPAYAAAD